MVYYEWKQGKHFFVLKIGISALNRIDQFSENSQTDQTMLFFILGPGKPAPGPVRNYSPPIASMNPKAPLQCGHLGRYLSGTAFITYYNSDMYKQTSNPRRFGTRQFLGCQRRKPPKGR